MEVFCEICGSKFTRKASLTRHLQHIHDVVLPQAKAGKEKKASCGTCGGLFATKGSLERHMKRIHQERKPEKPFEALCDECGATFAANKQLYVHIKTKHNVEESTAENLFKKFNVTCILCFKEKNIATFKNYMEYNRHLEEIHEEKIVTVNKSFTDEEEFAKWRSKHYSLYSNTVLKTHVIKYYNCNRSGCKDSSKRQSIKINGTCPSRIVATVYSNGSVNVKFTETHIGHEITVKTMQLSKHEQNVISQQLEAGISVDQILKNARDGADPNNLTRLNVIKRKDIRNIERLQNIRNIRHPDDMIATAINVAETNEKDENSVFLFKPMGKSHDVLNEQDFALGYMSSIMETKFKLFGNIICIDSTHGLTKYKGFEVTTILVKDNSKVGFPVAFLISNRKDQIMIEIFLTALKEKLGTVVHTKFLMSDDDIKYINAWKKIMNLTTERLLCSWHIIKNWNIQGKKKLKSPELKKTMKKDMRLIMQATKADNFKNLATKYFEKLERNNESEFIQYLQKKYFKDEEKIREWAFFNRVNVGINTNMALESLHKYIKYNKLNRCGYIRIERLLDVLKIVAIEKTWTAIVVKERPDGDSYQRREISRAHKEGSKLINQVKEQTDGNFKVTSKAGCIYKVINKGACGSCSLACNDCMVCYHKFKCECYDYLIKTNPCKHLHAVMLFKNQFQSVSDDIPEIETTNENKILHMVLAEQINEIELEKSSKMNILLEHFDNTVNLFRQSPRISETTLENCIKIMKREIDVVQECKRQKIEKQQYFPSGSK